MNYELDHSPADIVAQLLQDGGLGSDPANGGDWPITVGSEPDGPDDHITIYDTAGTNSGRENITGRRTEQHGIQVRIRSNSHSPGYQKAQALATYVDQSVDKATAHLDSSSYLVTTITRTGNVFSLGRESPESKRLIWVFNALVTVSKTS